MDLSQQMTPCSSLLIILHTWTSCCHHSRSFYFDSLSPTNYWPFPRISYSAVYIVLWKFNTDCVIPHLNLSVFFFLPLAKGQYSSLGAQGLGCSGPASSISFILQLPTSYVAFRVTFLLFLFTRSLSSLDHWMCKWSFVSETLCPPFLAHSNFYFIS